MKKKKTSNIQTMFIVHRYKYILFIVAFDLWLTLHSRQVRKWIDENTYTEKFMLRCKLLLHLSILSINLLTNIQHRVRA